MDSGTIVDFGSAKPAFGNPDAVAEYNTPVEIRGWWEQKNGRSPIAVKGLMGDGVPYADSTADALIDYICVSHYMIGRQKPGVDGYDYWLANKYREAEELKQQKKYKELYQMFENYWQRFQVAAYTLIRMYIPPDSDKTPETLVAEDATNPFELADGLLDWFPLSELQKMGMLGLAIMPPDTPATVMVHDINIKRIKIAQNENAHLDAVRGRWEAAGINVIPGVTSSGRTQELVKLHEQFIAAQAEQNAEREAVLAAWRQKNDEAAANQARAENAEDVARRAAAEAQAQAERAVQAEAQVGNLLAEGNQLIGVQVARAENAENIAAAQAQRAAEAENKVNQLLQAGKQEIGNLVKQKEVLVDNYQLLQQRMADHIARAQKEKAALEEQNRARLQYAEAKHKIVLERVQNEIMAKYEAELKKELERIRELEARVIECDANKAQMQAELMQLAGDKNALLDDYKQLQQKMATPVTPAPAAEPAAAPDTATLPVAASAPPATTAITPAAPVPAVASAVAPVAAPVATTAAPVSPASATAPSLDSITVGGKTYTKADIESMQRVQVESDKWARHWIEKQKAQKKADAWWAKHPGAEKRDKAVKAKTVVKYASEYVPGKNDFLGVDTAKSSGRARKVKFI